jgi:hypothetical protein
MLYLQLGANQSYSLCPKKNVILEILLGENLAWHNHNQPEWL